MLFFFRTAQARSERVHPKQGCDCRVNQRQRSENDNHFTALVNLRFDATARLPDLQFNAPLFPTLSARPLLVTLSLSLPATHRQIQLRQGQTPRIFTMLNDLNTKNAGEFVLWDPTTGVQQCASGVKTPHERITLILLSRFSSPTPPG